MTTICFLLLGLSLLLIVNQPVSSANADDSSIFRFSLINNNNEYSISLIDKTVKNITIPSDYLDKPITEITMNGFQGSANLETVIIPSSIVKINSGAFLNCVNLTRVHIITAKENNQRVAITKGVREIGANAFSMSTKLKNIIIPKTVMTIGSGVFRNNKNKIFLRHNKGEIDISPMLIGYAGDPEKDIIYGEDNLVYDEVFGENNQPALSVSFYQGIDNPNGNLIIPSIYNLTISSLYPEYVGRQIINIGSFAFTGCELNSLKINESSHKLTISSYAFYATNIQNIDFSSNTIINENETSIFTGSKTVYIGLTDSIKQINSGMFQDCTELTEIKFDYYPKNYLPSDINLIDEYAFSNCPKLQYINISVNIQNAEQNIFDGWTTSQTIEINFAKQPVGWATNWQGDSKAKVIFNDDNCSYEYNDNTKETVKVTKFKDVNANVIIAEECFSAPVTTIDNKVFAFSTKLTSIKIPSTITSISSYAFIDCVSLKSVVLSEGLISIQYGAFGYCRALETINFPKSLRIIEESAFFNCQSMNNIDLNENLTLIGESAFSFCKALKIIEIPDCYLGKRAFQGCSGLEVLTIKSNSIDSSYYEIFDLCDSLETINLYSEDIPSIFSNCKSLVTLNVYSSIIGFSSFSNCSNLTQVNFYNDNFQLIEPHAFIECTSLENIDLPDSLMKIGQYAFYNCISLRSIDIPDECSVEIFSFYNCRSLETVTIRSSLIGTFAFGNCNAITILNLYNSIEGQFNGSTSLKTINFYGSSIGNYAFADCTALTTVNIFSNLISIGHGAFYNCTSVGSINIPNSVSYIGEGAFMFWKNNQIIRIQNPSQINLWSSVWDINCSAIIQYY